MVRKPGTRGAFQAALHSKLPFVAEIIICEGRDIIRLETDHPFGTKAKPADVTRFVTILPQDARVAHAIPIVLPPKGKWLVRIIAARDRFVFGEYRRDMKTIGYLGQLDKLANVRGTTRNWNTIAAIVGILKIGNRQSPSGNERDPSLRSG